MTLETDKQYFTFVLMTKSICYSFIYLLIILLLTDCKKEKESQGSIIQTFVPTVKTRFVNNVRAYSAVGVGTVTNEGGTPVLEKGIVYSKKANPVYGDSISLKADTSGAGAGEFSVLLNKHIIPGTQYHFRAYARNAKGIGYGTELIFTSMSIGYPGAITGVVSNITDSSAVCTGTVSYDGGIPVLECGVCWDQSGGPSINDSKSSIIFQNTTFSCTLNNLIPNWIYHVRAFARNSHGAGYGNVITFTTAATAPVN